MRLRTDDDIYRARLVYLGPPGYTLPIQLPYAQYGLFVLLVPTFMGIRWVLTALFTGHDDLIRVPSRGSRPSGPDGHPHRAHRLASHPRAGHRTS